MKLWQKNKDTNKEVEKFSVGNDYLIDQKLVKYDCLASIAHAKMLKKIGILKDVELKKAIQGLNEIVRLSKQGKFEIRPEDEDCHTAIENYLTKKYGETGKKIHTLRSRNDQVLTAVRLYEKNEIKTIIQLIKNYENSLSIIIKKYGKTPLPGYTHMQKAMPTNIETWLGAYLDSSKDNLELLEEAYEIIDQSPLGSAAGFGVPVFKIDREMTAKEMGFEKIQKNPIYTQMSRGKFEATIIFSLSQIMYDLNKLSTDLILFSMKEFGYIKIPKTFCTGSSIMPQKNNPDILELVRAKYHIILGEQFKLQSLISNLISGYNRDLQLTKEPLFNSVEITKNSLSIMASLLKEIEVNKVACKKAMTKELYATEEAYKLVKKGKPFREAYRIIGQKYAK